MHIYMYIYGEREKHVYMYVVIINEEGGHELEREPVELVVWEHFKGE